MSQKKSRYNVHALKTVGRLKKKKINMQSN